MKFLSLLPLAALALAAPTEVARSSHKSSTDVYCGKVDYYQSDVTTAANAACPYVQNDSEAGSSDYPHVYNDYEGFNFKSSGPYYEFPILSSYKAYTGGSPGADRVIITGSCAIMGVITHTGASGDDFVACTNGIFS